MENKENTASLYALEKAQEAFEGFAEENALENLDDVVAMVKKVRAEKPEQTHS